MSGILFIIGAFAVVLGGVIIVGFGIPVSEFSFGNTRLLSPVRRSPWAA